MYDFSREYLEMKRCRALHIAFTLSNSRMLTHVHVRYVFSRMLTYAHVLHIGFTLSANGCITRLLDKSCGFKVLVYEALRYLCMRP